MPDSPKKIALGVALGTSLNFLPMPFISIPISYLLAKLTRVNATAAVLSVIFFKWAVPLFFTFNYYLGRQILGEKPISYVQQKFSMLNLSNLTIWWNDLGIPFLLGAAVNSVVAGVFTYYVIRAFFYYKLQKENKIMGD